MAAAYLDQARDIAPGELVDRDRELAQWAEFCAGHDAYAWWQGAPWAGKSALASWFVIHPPADVDVASFFLTGQLGGQADSDAFLEAMVGQLAALAPADARFPARPRADTWLSWLGSAAAHAEERARRLVVVVDGLDEDDVAITLPGGRPSIASLLPAHPPSGTRFIVTSRSGLRLPDDVPSGHPLRGCTPCHLPASALAEDLAVRADHELRNLLRGDRAPRDVVGYIAASGGGLTGSDLSALTGADPLELDPILASACCLQTRAPADRCGAGADPAIRAYLFAHETLRVTAEDYLGDELAHYGQGIHDWIGSHASGGWPDMTPGYAIRGYPRLLTATGDVTRLSALARDPRRHVFLRRATWEDDAALTEIRDAQNLIADQNPPDLQALVELAVYRQALGPRTWSIPAELPVVWARLGRFDRAEALARTIPDPSERAQVLTGLVGAAGQAGDRDRATRLAADAETLARTITHSDVRARAVTGLVSAAAQAGGQDRAARLAADAEALACALTDRHKQAQALAALARAVAQAGDPERAETLARTITDPSEQAWAVTELASTAAQADDPGRAIRLATDAKILVYTMPDPGAQSLVLASLAYTAGQAGDPDLATRLAADAEALARIITAPNQQALALTALVAAAAEAGDANRAARLAADAEAIARTITYPDDQALTLTALATVAAEAGDTDRAAGLAADAEAVADDITDGSARAQALTELASAVAQAGDLNRGEALARTITDPSARARALTALASGADDPDRASRLAADAEALACTATDPSAQAKAISVLATGAARAGDVGRAEALIRTITDQSAQGRARARLAIRTQAGDSTWPALMATDAAALMRINTRTLTPSSDEARELAGIARSAAEAGDLDRAEALARYITDPYYRTRTLTELARAAAEAGDTDRAARLATEAGVVARAIIDDRDDQARAQLLLVTAADQAGDPDGAETLARTMTHPGFRAEALIWLAAKAVKADDLDRAEALTRAVTHPGYLLRALTELARAAARAGDLDRARRLLALALCVDSAEIDWCVEGLAHLFPSAVTGAADVFVRMSHFATRPYSLMT